MKKLFGRLAAGATVLSLAAAAFAGCSSTDGGGSSSGSSGASASGDTVKIGLVFSLTGSTAITEECMVNAAELAIDEINAAGGIGGKQIEYVVQDYSSDADTAASVVREMIMQDGVQAIIGPYTSAARVAIEPVIEEYEIPLIYPTFYEGETPNDYVIYTGAVPNQQGDYFVPYLYENVSHNFYLIGTDTTYASAINEQAQALVEELGGTVIGNELVSSDTTEFSDILARIRDACGDEGCVIYANLNGDSGTAFYTQFSQAGLSDQYTIASFIMDESFSTALGSAAVGTYASVNYFNSLDTEETQAFLEAYGEAYGEDKAAAVTAVGEASYDSVYLLALAMEACGDDLTTENILANFDNLEFDAPQGTITVDPDTHHIYCKARIGQVQEDGSIAVVWESDDVIKAEPVQE